MDITIQGPCFYHQEDENIFFSCIYNLPGYQQIKGHGVELTISFANDISEQAVMQLLIICRRWSIDPTPLLIFKTCSNPECSLWKSAIEFSK